MRLEDFEAMWSTEKSKYVLLKDPNGYLPGDVSGETPMAVLIDEDDEPAEGVVREMREAGVPIVDQLTPQRSRELERS